MRRAVLIGTGSALPARRVSNAELARDGRHHRRMDRRAHRHPLPPHRRPRRDHRHAGAPTRRARRSPRRACAPQDIDLIVLATATPDQTFPATATKVQAMLGIDDCVAFDVGAVCSGFLYAVQVADSDDPHRRAQPRAGDRRGDVQPHPRLGGPRDLRAVRRRRRRDRARGAGSGRGRAAASSPPSSTPTGATTNCSMSMAAPRPPAPSASCG